MFTRTNNTFVSYQDMPLSPIPYIHLADMHLQAVIAFMNYRDSLPIAYAPSIEQKELLDTLYRIAADLHNAMNYRLSDPSLVVSFYTFIKNQDKYK